MGSSIFQECGYNVWKPSKNGLKFLHLIIFGGLSHNVHTISKCATKYCTRMSSHVHHQKHYVHHKKLLELSQLFCLISTVWICTAHTLRLVAHTHQQWMWDKLLDPLWTVQLHLMSQYICYTPYDTQVSRNGVRIAWNFRYFSYNHFPNAPFLLHVNTAHIR